MQLNPACSRLDWLNAQGGQRVGGSQDAAKARQTQRTIKLRELEAHLKQEVTIMHEVFTS